MALADDRLAEGGGVISGKKFRRALFGPDGCALAMADAVNPDKLAVAGFLTVDIGQARHGH